MGQDQIVAAKGGHLMAEGIAIQNLGFTFGTWVGVGKAAVPFWGIATLGWPLEAKVAGFIGIGFPSVVDYG